MPPPTREPLRHPVDPGQTAVCVPHRNAGGWHRGTDPSSARSDGFAGAGNAVGDEQKRRWRLSQGVRQLQIGLAADEPAAALLHMATRGWLAWIALTLARTMAR